MAEKTAKRIRGYGNGTVYFRASDQRWVGKYKIGVKPDGKPDMKVVYAKTEPECHRKLKDIIDEAKKTDYVYVAKDTVGSYMTSWLTAVKALELKPKSYDRLEQTVNNQVIPYIGQLQLQSITSDDVRSMISTLTAEGKSYSSIKKAYEAVNAAFKWGQLCDPPKVKKNPAANIKLPNKKLFTQKQIPFYTAEEAAQLIACATRICDNGARRYPLGAFVPLLINTGLRASEVLALKWESDIDMENRTLTVHNNVVFVKDREKEKGYKLIEQDTVKTDAGQDRTIPLNDAAYNALLNLQKLTGKKTWVMTTRNNTQTKPRQLDQMFRRIAVAADMPEEKIYGVHALRHTFATLLLSNGVEIKTVSELLGHADVTITYNTYIHVIKEQKAKALDALPELTMNNNDNNKQ